jgi:enediyne biosynthesis protein E7
MFPPGPSQPVTAEHIRLDPLGFLESQRSEFGPVSTHLTEHGQRVFLISSPDIAREVLLAPEERFTKQGTPDDAMLTPLLGEGLLTSHGDSWRAQREYTNPMFQRRRVEQFGGAIQRQAAQLVADWTSRDETQPIRVDHDLTGLTLQVVVTAILGGELGDIGEGFGRAVDAVNAAVSHGDPRDTPDTDVVRADFASFVTARQTIDRIVRLLIRARRFVGTDDSGLPDLLGVLLEHRTPAGEALSDRELRDQVMTMVMAGHETTAKALTWSLYLLSQHPSIAADVRIEVNRVCGDSPPTVAQLPELAMTRAVINEAMRLYPPIWVISRRAVSDDQLSGFDVPADSLVCVSPWLIHREADLWPDPTEFKPRRFVEIESPDPFTFLPFGGGPRLCIGRGFALMEAQLVLATLCRDVDFELWPGHEVLPEALVTLKPAEGMPMRVRRP